MRLSAGSGDTSIARWVALMAAAGLMAVAGCAAPTAPERREPPNLVWPLPPEQPRIRFIGEFRYQRDAEEGRDTGGSIADILLGRRDDDRGDAQLNKPYGVHADRNGRIYVTDTGYGKLVLFDTKNKKFDIWGLQGNGQLAKPIGVTSDSQGRVYVSDALQRRIVVFDRDGKFLNAFGGKEELGRPAGIALDEEAGRLYVVDIKKHNIAVFDPAGTRIDTIGERGVGPGQFNFPTNIAMDRQGRLYVADSGNFRIQVLEPDGTFISTFGQVGDSLGSFARPKGIGVDSEGNVYVVDAAFNNIQIFNQEGTLLLHVGSIGRDPGQFWLPAGMYIDESDRLYVVDQYNFRIQVFQFLGGQTAEPAAVKSETADERKKPAN